MSNGKNKNITVDFQQFLSIFSAGLIIIYAFTWGYIYELGIPESPDFTKAAYFFFSVFSTTIFHGTIDYLFSYGSLYQEARFYLCILVVLLVIVKYFFPIKIARYATIDGFKELFHKKLKKVFYVLIVLIPLGSVLLIDNQYAPAISYSTRLQKWILLDKRFLFYFLGLLFSFAGPVLFPLRIWPEKKKVIAYALWTFLIFYGAMVSFYLSKKGLEFMHFPVAITDKLILERYPHLWFSDKGRYIAYCDETKWRLVGVNYDNKEFFISDPRSDNFHAVCRFKTAWN